MSGDLATAFWKLLAVKLAMKRRFGRLWTVRGSLKRRFGPLKHGFGSLWTVRGALKQRFWDFFPGSFGKRAFCENRGFT